MSPKAKVHLPKCTQHNQDDATLPEQEELQRLAMQPEYMNKKSQGKDKEKEKEKKQKRKKVRVKVKKFKKNTKRKRKRKEKHDIKNKEMWGKKKDDKDPSIFIQKGNHNGKSKITTKSN